MNCVFERNIYFIFVIALAVFLIQIKFLNVFNVTTESDIYLPECNIYFLFTFILQKTGINYLYA